MSADSARWRRLEEICQAALERPADKRAAFVAEACGGDEDLRREVHSLLDREDRAEGFLAAPVGELAANAMPYSPAGPSRQDSMRDLIGRRIGAYEIRSRLGAGGMGEVYRAHDHTLNRDVAIKVLPETFSADPERLARFEREARLLASLNHPNVGAIYGLEGTGHLRALVLELIDGETLLRRLERGPIPTAQAVMLAEQIAEALDHAHRRGVTHRDLKPANVMLTKTGAKLLDFGIAKLSREQRAAASLTDAKTLTQGGTILGTAHYMAPEQLEGGDVDARADLFAFGTVLYEMLTGHKAFDGGSAAAVMAAVLHNEPSPIDVTHSAVPRSLDRLVRKCLAKDPDLRWQTARDLADELRWIRDEPVAEVTSSGPPRRAGILAVIGAIAVALAGWAGWQFASSRAPSATRTITRFDVQPPVTTPAFDISPDGSMLVYEGGGLAPLLIRRLDQFGDAPIAGTEAGGGPFFSPDNQWVAYFSNGRLMKVSVSGGAPPILLANGIDSWLDNSATWLEDGNILLGVATKGLQRVSTEGGAAVQITSLNETPPEFDHHSPSMLPDGKTLLFTLHASDGRFHIVVEDIASAKRKRVIESAHDARYMPSGHLVFSRNQTLLAVPFDLQRLAITGAEVTIVEPVEGEPINGNGGYRVSANGTLVFRHPPSIEGRTLAWVDRAGVETNIPITARAFSSPSVSPDGQRLAFAVADGNRRDIWTYEIASERLARVTRAGDNRTPIWTRDGRRLAYSSVRDEVRQLLLQGADGSDAAVPLVQGRMLLVPGAWSVDSQHLVYSDGDSGPTGSKMFTLSWQGDRKPQPLLDAAGEERAPSISPDGRWLAYTGNETGRAEIYVSGFPATGSRRQVSFDGGREPKWSRDGREIVYRFGRRVFAVRIDTTRGFSAGKPKVLFERRYVVGVVEVGGLDYDLAPDGRFLMIKPGPEEERPHVLRVVVNWADELKTRFAKTH